MENTNRPDGLVTTFFVVEYRQNLTACDTFNEDTFEGPTQRTHQVYGFMTEDEAMKFYEQRRASLRFAGAAGDYYTYPTKLEFPWNPKTSVVIECVTEDGGYYSVAVRAKKEVCWRCDGEGTHVNPSVDGRGLSSEDLADDDFRESYMRGDYDVKCEECGGNKILKVPDLSELPVNIEEDYQRLEDEKRQNEQEAAAERRYFERARGEF